MTKTALTILIERYDKMLDEIKHMDAPDTKETVQMFKNEAISLLDAESAIIQQSYIDGITHRSELKCKLPDTYLTKFYEQYTPTPNSDKNVEDKG